MGAERHHHPLLYHWDWGRYVFWENNAMGGSWPRQHLQLRNMSMAQGTLLTLQKESRCGRCCQRVMDSNYWLQLWTQHCLFWSFLLLWSLQFGAFLFHYNFPPKNSVLSAPSRLSWIIRGEVVMVFSPKFALDWKQFLQTPWYCPAHPQNRTGLEISSAQRLQTSSSLNLN